MLPQPNVVAEYAASVPDREGMEKRTGKDWSKIVEFRDADLDAVAGIVKELLAGGRKAWVFVNNHFEGCAPLSIQRLQERLGKTDA